MDYFLLEKGRVIADRVNLDRERLLAWLDLAEAICWLFILALIELNVRWQERGITGGTAFDAGKYLKFGAYSMITGIAVYWGLTDLFLYFWDEMLWIGALPPSK